MQLTGCPLVMDFLKNYLHKLSQPNWYKLAEPVIH